MSLACEICDAEISTGRWCSDCAKLYFTPCGEGGHTVADEKGDCFQCGMPVKDLEGGTPAAPCVVVQGPRCLTYPNCQCGGVA